MKKFVCLLLLGMLTAPLAADESRIFPYDASVETLDNGLQVIVVPMNSGGLASFWTIVRTGSRDEYEPGHSGFAHFFEHMMFRGTEKYPADIYNQKITEIGANANAFTTDDFTAYHLDIASSDLETVMDLESDRFQNLAYPFEMFQTEAGAVYGEYRKNRLQPFFALMEGLRKVAFEEHTYGHTTMGYVEDIQRMPEMFDYSRTFFDRYYRPENTILFIAGDVDPSNAQAMAKKYYGAWKQGYVVPTIPVEPEQTEERSVEVSYEGNTLPIVWMAYKGYAFDAKDRDQAAMRLLCELAFGNTSALHKKLVLNEQAVEFVAAQVDLNRDANTIDIISRIKDASKIDYVMSEIDATIAHYRDNPPAAERLVALQSRLKYAFLMGLDTPANVAGGLARILAVTADLGAVDQMFQTMSAVTPADVQQAAQNYLVNSRRTVGVLKGGK